MTINTFLLESAWWSLKEWLILVTLRIEWKWYPPSHEIMIFLQLILERKYNLKKKNKKKLSIFEINYQWIIVGLCKQIKVWKAYKLEYAQYFLFCYFCSTKRALKLKLYLLFSNNNVSKSAWQGKNDKEKTSRPNHPIQTDMYTVAYNRHLHTYAYTQAHTHTFNPTHTTVREEA